VIERHVCQIVMFESECMLRPKALITQLNPAFLVPEGREITLKCGINICKGMKFHGSTIAQGFI